MTRPAAVVGAGFSGAVIARQLAQSGGRRVLVFDERPHLAGNCHTERDPRTGILLHAYGPHVFHTDREDVWAYVNRFGRFSQFVNRVKAVTERGVFSLPINLQTINQFFGKSFGPAEAREFVRSLCVPLGREPENFEEQALATVGREMYENFFRGYTLKQWGVDPRRLPASVLKRLPLRFDYDDNYYDSRFQGIPLDGYTELVRRILDHPAVEVRLGERFDPSAKREFEHVFYSGPLDGYYGHRLGRLRYRSLEFERFEAEGDFQGNAIMNYCSEAVEFTRITEPKHFMPWENHARTVCLREYSKEAREGDVLFYPTRLEADKSLLGKYMALAMQDDGVSFLGRLGTYRYLDMDKVIGEALDLAAGYLSRAPGRPFPAFSPALVDSDSGASLCRDGSTQAVVPG